MHMHTIPTLSNLPPAIAREVFANLRSALPLPVPDTAEARAAREEAAVAAVAALDPADAFEAQLAAQIVGADAQAKECFRLAVVPGTTPEAAHCHRAQAAVMMRHMQSGLRMLERRQAAREKALAALQPAAMERAGYWFHEITVSPAPAVSEPAAAEAPPDPAPPPPAEPVKPDFEDMREAEQYAIIYPDRAARIRAAGGLPPRCEFGPPAPDLVAALVSGVSPILRALDQPADALV
jgi:hypothetical protein